MTLRTQEQIIESLKGALLETKMMNQLFVDRIETGEVDEQHVAAALENFRQAMHPTPKAVAHRYVLGFMFDHEEKHVLLIWKNRPKWQAGKLNGIGGKIEAGETPLQAMEREFTEETFFKAMHRFEPDEVFGDTITPQWELVGKRHRAATFDYQPASYEMFIFACHFDSKACLFSTAGAANRDAFTEWQVPVHQFEPHEEVINLPLNREIIAQRGVPGLAWCVDIALRALHENYLVNVEDPMVLDEDEDFTRAPRSETL